MDTVNLGGSFVLVVVPSIAWELPELRVVDVGDLWTAQNVVDEQGAQLAQNSTQAREQTMKAIGHCRLDCELKAKAEQSIPFEESVDVEQASSQFFCRDTGERVCCASVAAYAEELKVVVQVGEFGIDDSRRQGVWRERVALVKVLRDSFMTFGGVSGDAVSNPMKCGLPWSIRKVAIFARDGVE